jgi:hypothetical protein
MVLRTSLLTPNLGISSQMKDGVAAIESFIDRFLVENISLKHL